MPSLREIPEDIPLIMTQVAERLARQNGMTLPEFAADARQSLLDYDYPGNVRELENILERALALCDGNTIRAGDLYLTESRESAGANVAAGERTQPLHEYLDQIERQQIVKALEATRFNKTAAAKVLGITFRSLRYRLDRLGIE